MKSKLFNHLEFQGSKFCVPSSLHENLWAEQHTTFFGNLCVVPAQVPASFSSQPWFHRLYGQHHRVGMLSMQDDASEVEQRFPLGPL